MTKRETYLAEQDVIEAARALLLVADKTPGDPVAIAAATLTVLVRTRALEATEVE
jgi:hypothetical protein